MNIIINIYYTHRRSKEQNLSNSEHEPMQDFSNNLISHLVLINYTLIGDRPKRYRPNAL